MSADRVGAWGSPGARTPNLDRRARTGLQVRDAVSPAPLTAPSHATILTGRIPPRHGIRENGGFLLEEGVRTVAERLPSGVRRAAFVAAAPLLRGSGLERGFEPYDDALGTLPDGTPRAERPAAEVLAAAQAWLAGQRASAAVFAWVHLFDPHYPWEPPPPWSGLAPAGDSGAHEAEIAAVDHALERFLRGIARPAVVIVTADHGESLGAHGEITHGFFTYDATQRVPLVVTGAGVPPRLEAGPRSVASIASFILERFGAEAQAEDPPSLDGPEPAASTIHYLETFHPELLYGLSAVRAARTDRWKYIALPRPELYDLRADPAEQHNRLSEEPETADRLRRWIDRQSDGGLSPAAPALEPELAARLRALGYVAASGPGHRGGRNLPDPKDAIAAVSNVFRGLDALRRDDAASAIRFLEAAAAARPGDRETHHHLARARLLRGDAAGAAREARRALELRPPTSEVELRVILGQALLAEGLPAEALPHLELAARARPTDPGIRDRLDEARRRMR